jgi:hypothetical protein
MHLPGVQSELNDVPSRPRDKCLNYRACPLRTHVSSGSAARERPPNTPSVVDSPTRGGKTPSRYPSRELPPRRHRLGGDPEEAVRLAHGENPIARGIVCQVQHTTCAARASSKPKRSAGKSLRSRRPLNARSSRFERSEVLKISPITWRFCATSTPVGATSSSFAEADEALRRSQV